MSGVLVEPGRGGCKAGSMGCRAVRSRRASVAAAAAAEAAAAAAAVNSALLPCFIHRLETIQPMLLAHVLHRGNGYRRNNLDNPVVHGLWSPVCRACRRNLRHKSLMQPSAGRTSSLQLLQACNCCKFAYT